MKLQSIIFNLLFLSSCHDNDIKNYRSDKIIVDNLVKPCEIDYDSLLFKYSRSFNATEINLDKCFSDEERSFILKVDTSCLESQTEYEKFTAIILAKLYYNHLKCCNQGYDLLSMKEGAAAVIINYFQKIGGYKNQNLEMLNSGIIIDYIDRQPYFKNSKIIQELRGQIKKEIRRIESNKF